MTTWRDSNYDVKNAMTTVPRIVITGAPASGKTDFFERLRRHAAFADFLFFEELARMLLVEDPGYRNRWGDFHREIYRRQIERERLAEDRPFITDRGTGDAFAFHPETVADVGTTLEAEHRRYTAVIQLGSSARLGAAFYPQDNVRIEQLDEALRIEESIRRIWSAHPGYRFLPAEKSLEAKYVAFEALILPLGEKLPGDN